MDLEIRNVAVRRDVETVDIDIDVGPIGKLDAEIDLVEARAIDAGGGLVLPTLNGAITRLGPIPVAERDESSHQVRVIGTSSPPHTRT